MAFMGAATSKRRGGSAAAVLDFAVAQILGDDTALGALPAVLARGSAHRDGDRPGRPGTAFIG